VAQTLLSAGEGDSTSLRTVELVIKQVGGVEVTRLLPEGNVLVLFDHLSLGAKGVEVKILPAQENFTDPLKVPSDFLFRPKPLPSRINQVRVPTSSCCPSHPLSHFPAPSRRQSWIVEKWDLVPLVTVVSPWRPVLHHVWLEEKVCSVCLKTARVDKRQRGEIVS